MGADDPPCSALRDATSTSRSSTRRGAPFVWERALILENSSLFAKAGRCCESLLKGPNVCASASDPQLYNCAYVTAVLRLALTYVPPYLKLKPESRLRSWMSGFVAILVAASLSASHCASGCKSVSQSARRDWTTVRRLRSSTIFRSPSPAC